MPVTRYISKILILSFCMVLLPGLVSANSEEQEASDLQDHQVITADEIVASEAEVNKLALNNALVSPEKSLKEVVADKGPVLFVPMVLVVLALVAVSRRKEHD